MKNKTLITALACLSAVSLTCCNKNKEGKKPNPIDENTISFKGINLYYNASDDDMTTFLNDFTHRNMRYDSDACGEFPVTHGTGFAKNWESMAVTFQNASRDAYRDSRDEGVNKIQRIANYLIQASQDDQGLIYNTPMTIEGPFSAAGKDSTGYCVPQGWPFPYWKMSTSNFLDEGMLEATHTTEFNFNSGWDEQSQGWKAENGTIQTPSLFVEPSGYADFSSAEGIAIGESFRFYRDELATLLPVSQGIDTRYAPMMDIDIAFTGQNIKDYNIIFKVEGDDSWHRIPQSAYASTPLTSFENVHVRQFIDMYLNPEWNKKIVTALGVEFVPVEGQKLVIESGRVNYIRPSYDTRQSNATYQFILALYNYYIFTRDIKTLTKLMNKARRGLLFLTHALEGEKGLLSLEYLYGHDGVIPYCIDPDDRSAYHGIGNGYWDLTVSPMYNLEANIYFYQALNAMAILEGEMEAVESDNKNNVKVKNRLPYEDDVYYQYDKASLKELAATVKTNFQKDINVVKEENFSSFTAGDYHYQNKGGFYNPETGRFALGINEYNGEVLDFGYVYYNLEAVCAGLGSDEQQLSIMKWIDGQRIVEGDNSTGKDIYFYEFAPRYNTLDCDSYLGFSRDINFYYQLYVYGYRTWSRQLQNGGAAIAWSYYDLVARSRVLGVENALQRLDEIKTWYMKVLDNGGNALEFYNDYYQGVQSEAELEDPDMYMVYSVQNAAVRGAGALGLDAEFIESVILIRAIPDALFGMDASEKNNIQFTYGENQLHDFFEIYNMKYGNAVYSIRSKKNVMEVFNIGGQVSKDFTITFKYKTDNANLPVKVNGEAFNNVKMANGYAYVTVPFGNVKVIFG